MPVNDALRIEVANHTTEVYAQDRILTPVQAKSFVRSLQTTWQVDTLPWSQGESRETLSQAQRLIHAGNILTSVEGGSEEDAKLCFRRAGELFEWLARSGDDLTNDAPLALFAAGAYQLGGLPAMSSGLLRQVRYRDDGLSLFADFLSADFDRVLERCGGFWAKNPELTAKDSASAFFRSPEQNDLSWHATVEIVRCLGLAARSLRVGDTVRSEAALQQLRRVERFLKRSAPDDAAMTAFFLKASLEKYVRVSIYQSLRELAALRPARESYLERFGRRQFARGRGLMWQSQQKGLERLINGSSFAMCTPTGSGKTLVANMAIVKELLLLANGALAPLALYIVPSRALAGEVEAKLKGELGREFVVTGLYGGADWGVTDAWLNTDTPTVLIATVEKADAIMRYLGPMLVARLTLLIVDEAHQVVVSGSSRDREDLASHSSRAVRLENLVSKILARKPDITRIALTAVAGGAAGTVARWIESDADAEPVGEAYRSTRQAVGVLEIRPRSTPTIYLDRLNDHELAVRGSDEGVFINLRIPPMPDPLATIRGGLNHYCQNYILWTAMHVVESGRRVLISLMQSPEDTIRWYSEAFDLPGWEELPAFKLPAEGPDADLFVEARAVCADYCGEESYEVRLLDHGIATNHGQMPQRLRRMMVALIEKSICRVTVATATLTEGVNLPFDIVILPAITRSSFNPDRVPRFQEELISSAEFRNLSGRAGRPGTAEGMEGMTLVALPSFPSAWKTARADWSRQSGQLRDLRHWYDRLLGQLAEEEHGGGNLQSPLALLLELIRERAERLAGVQSDEQFLQWLETTAPTDISEDAGMLRGTEPSRLADTLDELDGVILGAIEEIGSLDEAGMTGARAEEILARVWASTFASVAAEREAWLESAFVKRGSGVVENVYPDADERSRLYSYGFTPQVGRRFEDVVPVLTELLEDSDSYGDLPPHERTIVFASLGDEIAEDSGYGFNIRQTDAGRALFRKWHQVLAWWLKVPDVEGPKNNDLRAWQRFVADNLEFRLGVGIGAVVASRWHEGTEDAFEILSLDSWKEVTQLPWFAFWAKELLRWGTHEPFVAFSLSQGRAKSRSEAEELRSDFLTWLRAQPDLQEASGEDLIDPRHFMAWHRNTAEEQPRERRRELYNANLEGSDGSAGTYAVMPVPNENAIRWLDGSGYQLAVSEDAMPRGRVYANDYQLIVDDEVRVRRIFRGSDT